MSKILTVKTLILFAAFFAFFVFFAPLAQADTECSPPFDYVGSASACLGCWQLNADVCMDNNSPPPNKYCYNINRYGSTCTIDNTTTTGTCDESANCIASCTPDWECTAWSPSDGECGDTVDQTRTCTDSNSCGTTDGKPGESQTSTGTYCTSPVYGSWGACSDSYADSCDTSYSGTQSRTATSYACSSNVCSDSGSLPDETQNCSGSRTVSNITVYGTVSCPSGSSGSCTQYCDGAGGYTACTPSCTETACTDSVDNDGDGNTDSADSDCVPVDNTAPTVAVNQAAGQADPTNASPVNFTAVFSETPFGLDGSEVQITGTAGGTKTVTITGSGTTRNLAVSEMTNGTVIAAIPAGVFIDAAGNPNIASTSTDNVVAYDTAGPGTPGTPAPTTPPSNTTPTWTWTASTEGPAWYLVYWSATAGGTDNSATVFTNSFTHTTALAAGTWYMKVKAFDTAGNASAFSGNGSVMIDVTLTFPTNTWQRLWYTTSVDSPFVLDTFLGENTINNIDMDWGSNQLYNTTAPNTNNGKDKIGFKASRTYNLTGPYTITVGADDGIRLFVNGSNNLLNASAWDNDHSYSDNVHRVRVDLAGTTKIEIHYRENLGNAKLTFAYEPGFTDSAPEFQCHRGISCLNDPQGWMGCNNSGFYGPDGYCYYNASPSPPGCVADPQPTQCSVAGSCTYQSRCIVLPGQACTSQGCVEGTPPNVTVNTISGQWYKGNSLLDVDATDNVALQNIKYQIDSYTNDNAGTQVTSDGISNLTVSGTSVTTDWKIAAADWSGLSEGSHTIYVKAIDTSGSCKGCDGSKSFTIKKDTVAPSITIEEVKRNSPDLKVVTNNWLKAGIYEISMSVNDPNDVNGSGVDTAYRPVAIHSAGADKLFGTADDRVYSPSLVTYNKFNVWVGSPDSLANDCVDQEEGMCRVDITVRDNAGNPVAYLLYLNIDYTAPTAQ